MTRISLSAPSPFTIFMWVLSGKCLTSRVSPKNHRISARSLSWCWDLYFLAGGFGALRPPGRLAGGGGGGGGMDPSVGTGGIITGGGGGGTAPSAGAGCIPGTGGGGGLPAKRPGDGGGVICPTRS